MPKKKQEQKVNFDRRPSISSREKTNDGDDGADDGKGDADDETDEAGDADDDEVDKPAPERTEKLLNSSKTLLLFICLETLSHIAVDVVVVLDVNGNPSCSR